MPIFPHTQVVEVIDGAFSRAGTFRELRPRVSDIVGGLPDGILAEQGLMLPRLVTVLADGEVWDGEPDLANGQVINGEWAYSRPKRAKNSDEYAALAALLVKNIKGAAGDHILAAYPDWKQRNMTAEAASLTRVLAAGGSWTQEQADRAFVLDAAWAWVSTVRAASDAAEAAVLAATGDETAMRAAAAVAWPTP